MSTTHAIVAYWKASETTWKFRAPPAYAGILSENGKPVCKFVDQPLGGVRVLLPRDISPNLVEVGDGAFGNTKLHRFAPVFLRSAASLFSPRS